MGFFKKLLKPFPIEEKLAKFSTGQEKNPFQKDQEEEARTAVSQGQRAADFKRQQFDILREDIQPLRELRDENITRLLRLQGIGQPQDISEFRTSPEFTTVRDAALQVQGGTPGQTAELQDRATQLAEGTFGNFQNRIFNTAGFSSQGVGGTNRLLQQNVDAQVNLLNQAGSDAALGLRTGAQQRGQAASAGIGLLSAFCDVRLKENIELIGRYPGGLAKYRWDWTDEALELVGDQINEGPIAQEVKQVMPDNVGTMNGYLYIKDMTRIEVN